MCPGPTTRLNETGNMTHPDIFDEFESYRFSDDPEFRAGLPTVIAAIRGQERSADQIDEMIGRAQWFYFTRLKGVSIPWETYARRQRTHPYVDPASPKAGLVLSRTASPNASPSGLGPVPLPTTKRPSPQEALQTLNNLAEARQMMKDASVGEEGDKEGLSFAMLSRLIAEGRTGEVPVRQIPEGVNEVQPSQASMTARPKPWEVALAAPQFSPYGNGISPTFKIQSYTVPTPFGPPLGETIPYNTSPQMRWATTSSSGNPTISPDINSFDLDPDMAYTNTNTNTTTTTSSNSKQVSPTFASSTSLDDPFNAYMDFGDSASASRPNDAGQAGTSLSLPSPGVFTAAASSSSTPAPSTQRSDQTPSSSHSL